MDVLCKVKFSTTSFIEIKVVHCKIKHNFDSNKAYGQVLYYTHGLWLFFYEYSLGISQKKKIKCVAFQKIEFAHFQKT